MNRLLLIICLLFILTMPQAWGAASVSKYPNPYRQTMWNNITDAIHTWGQTPQQAQFNKMRLHYIRNFQRLKSINEAMQKARLRNN